ncbi:hypothetical protein D8B26_004270 [Coccidioides posadasii str. Silveira]|uniref:Uncharacterized protein n=1 Tax=Coccidioides posadasii (strain RMSCC 757 / Silveira) TaxID=443226 RepID=E9DCK9_COCPS|nr:conserved hypothetical protein [Coccidioides posadasii str. Silveira]QVM09615.1 hypothetical protein D8B26_004270 [Coccidioides posadasii str. Silveira]
MPVTSKPTLAPLDTSKSLVFPSELHDSPLFSAKFEMIKHEDALKTPITPPTAYTDLLKTLTPMIATPLSASAPSTSKSFSSSSSNPSTSTSPYFCTCQTHQKSLTTPLLTPLSATTTRSQPDRVQKPPRTPRTPRTPINVRSLRGSESAKASPVTESPRSASVRSLLSPVSGSHAESNVRYLDASRCSSCARPVIVRQVVTRTITYKRTPLDPAPKGKRRKMEEKK